MDYQSKVAAFTSITALVVGYCFGDSVILEFYVEKVKGFFRSFLNGKNS